MTQANKKSWLGSLTGLLESLIASQEALHDAIRGKLEAMRRSDVQEMLAAARREEEIVNQLAQMDQVRRETIASACAELGISGADKSNRPSVTLRALASRLAPAARDRLMLLSSRLRERMLAVGEANRVVELVCREMLLHFKTLFAAMVQEDGEPLTYRPGGADRAGGARVLDAVG